MPKARHEERKGQMSKIGRDFPNSLHSRKGLVLTTIPNLVQKSNRIPICISLMTEEAPLAVLGTFGRGKRFCLTGFYIPSWKRSPVSQLGEVQGSILLFINDCNLGTQLVKQLQQHNQKVIVVLVGKSFKKENDIYTLNPRQPKDYEILLLELGESIPRTILHLWTLELEGIDQALDLGFYRKSWDLRFWS